MYRHLNTDNTSRQGTFYTIMQSLIVFPSYFVTRLLLWKLAQGFVRVQLIQKMYGCF